MLNNLSNIYRIFKSYNYPGYIKARCKLHLTNRFSCQKVVNVVRKRRVFQKAEAAEEGKLSPFAISLLVVPVTTFGLGCWQIQRKKWKEGLIADLRCRRDRDPVPLPENFDELKEMEYYPVYVKGRFKYDREMYMGPRSLLLEEGKGNVSHGLGSQPKTGYLVVTPFELSDSGKTILVNRGWIPAEQFKNKAHIKTRNYGEVELTGIVRLNENRPQFGMKNKPESNLWHYRDLHKMSEMANSEPVFLDAVASNTLPGEPIGGQTRISLRNEHLSYIVTWFGLSLSTAGLWYLKYCRKVPA